MTDNTINCKHYVQNKLQLDFYMRMRIARRRRPNESANRHSIDVPLLYRSHESTSSYRSGELWGGQELSRLRPKVGLR
jgi:hypothetical protein